MDTEPMICLECDEDMREVACPECGGSGEDDFGICECPVCQGVGSIYRCPCCGYECDAEGYDL
jgi:RecJ-like exonuclease